MADDDIVRRAEDHLDRAVDRILDDERRLPELTRVTVKDFNPEDKAVEDRIEIGCDICEEYVAVAPGIDGWKTAEQPGPLSDPQRERVGYYVLCDPCKDSWEHGDYDDLYERCYVAHRVDDLAHLAGDTIRIRDRPGWDDGFDYEL